MTHLLSPWLFRLGHEGMCLSEFTKVLRRVDSIDTACYVEDLEQLRLLGLPVCEIPQKRVALTTASTSYRQERFCVVDLETSANTVKEGQILEIGAVLIQGGREIDRFESLVRAPFVPSVIEELTGIKTEDVVHAPSLPNVLERFRLFLHDSIFVAHHVGFDYKFLSDSLVQHGFGPMLNLGLCSLRLAQCLIPLERYGLQYLVKTLDLPVYPAHRALPDALSAKGVFEKCLEVLPNTLETTQDLLEFYADHCMRQQRSS